MTEDKHSNVINFKGHPEAMSYDDLPPGPFSYETVRRLGGSDHEGSGHVYLLDGNGRKIASMWGKKEEKMALVDLIIRARNFGLSGSQE
jgi:hypothetical protein